jgi:hypothetical protein
MTSIDTCAERQRHRRSESRFSKKVTVRRRENYLRTGAQERQMRIEDDVWVLDNRLCRPQRSVRDVERIFQSGTLK